MSNFGDTAFTSRSYVQLNAEEKKQALKDAINEIYKETTLDTQRILDHAFKQDEIGLIIAGIAKVPYNANELQRSRALFETTVALEDASRAILENREGEKNPELEKML